MRNQTAKKIRQYVRREVVKQFSLLKAKPRWMPGWIFRRLARLIVNWDKLVEISMKGMKIPKEL